MNPQSVSLKVIPAMQSEDGIFSDNLSHIEFLVDETKLWLAEAYLRLKQVHQFAADVESVQFLHLPPGIIDLESLAFHIAELAERKKRHEAVVLKQNICLRFRELVTEYELDPTEEKILQLLMVAETSLEFKALFEQCEIDFWNSGFRGNELEIGVIVSILCPEYREQLACRSCFSITRPLVKYELVKLSGHRGGLLSVDVELHDRISRYCLDDHNIYDTELLCIHAEKPTVKLSQVIIDPQIKEELLRYTESFLHNQSRKSSLYESFGYGTGLTCLFYGLSGTGKTMLAHGLANHLNCQLFSVNIGGLEHEDISFEDAMKHIFREARLAGGIVFLDECDDLFAENSYMSRTFLIEIEKAKCITILATNKTIAMDPALDRRISLKIQFNLPDKNDRLAIWKTLLPNNMEYGESVNLRDLATRYQFTGGLIKNALLMAAGNALMDSSVTTAGKIDIHANEIHQAAQHQSKSIFDLGSSGEAYNPNVNFSDLSIRKREKTKLQRMAELIPEMQSKKQGLCGLICSANIATAVESIDAVATATGLAIRQFSLSELFAKGEDAYKKTGRILNPLTPQPVSFLEYVFSSRPGQQEILMLIDDTHMLDEVLSDNTKHSSSSDWVNFINHIREFHGVLFVISTPVAATRLPIEFSCYLPLSYPLEEKQIQVWQKYFPDIPEQDVVDLVEQYPMYAREIDLLARHTIVSNHLEGVTVGTREIIVMAKRLRGVQTTPLLFGNQQ